MNIVSQPSTGAEAISNDIAPAVSDTWGMFLAIDFRRIGNSAPYRAYGWSGQEVDAVWTVGGRSGLKLPAIDSRDAIIADIDVEPCTIAPNISGQVLRIYANGHHLGSARLVGRTTLRCRIGPEIVRAGAPLEIGFEHPCFVLVDMAGGHDDNRRLAVRFRNVTLYSAHLAPSLGRYLADAVIGVLRDIDPPGEAADESVARDAFNRSYDFSGGANSDLLREGWFTDGAGKIWASSPVCRVEIPAPDNTVPYRLQVSLAPLLVRDLLPRQPITVLLHGCVIGQFRLASDTVLSLPLPKELIGIAPDLALTFLAPLGMAMSEFGGGNGGSNDRLSFLLERLDIEAVPAHLSAIVDMRGDDADSLSPMASSGRFLDIPLDDLPDAIEEELGITLEAILREFESLGDNCAFGLAQRKGGAEVLGLLRFANTPLKSLVSGLDDKFAAAADPANMAVRLNEVGDPPEYMLWLDRYGIRWHTQIHKPDADAETVFEQQSVKVGYLRRKFVEGIRAGRKIYSLARVDAIKVQKVMPPWGTGWTYELRREDLRRSEVLSVLLQLNRNARNTLIYFVVDTKYGRPSGTVEMLAPGLLIGYITNPTITEQTAIRDHIEWMRVIVNAWIIEHGANAAFRGGPNILERLAERESARLSSGSRTDDELQSDAAGSSGPDSPADLMHLFESIGENCEFGLVQRKCGADPLGLFRFTSVPYDKLVKALSQEFKGYGDPENVVVQVSSNGREYMVLDRQFGFEAHAWVLVDEMTPEEVHEREIKRIPFLVRKLKDDLRQGEKIFVHHAMQPLTLAQAKRLSMAMRRYGPNTLLWVELADADHPPGRVERIKAGLLKGYIDRFAPGEDAHDFSVESWIPLCREAYRLRGA